MVSRCGEVVAILHIVVGRTEIERVVLRSYVLETVTHSRDGFRAQGGRRQLAEKRLLYPLRQV